MVHGVLRQDLLVCSVFMGGGSLLSQTTARTTTFKVCGCLTKYTFQVYKPSS